MPYKDKDKAKEYNRGRMKKVRGNTREDVQPDNVLPECVTLSDGQVFDYLNQPESDLTMLSSQRIAEYRVLGRVRFVPLRDK